MADKVKSPTSVFFIESLLLPEEKRSSGFILRTLCAYGAVWMYDSAALYHAWHCAVMVILAYLWIVRIAREQPIA